MNLRGGGVLVVVVEGVVITIVVLVVLGVLKIILLLTLNISTSFIVGWVVDFLVTSGITLSSSTLSVINGVIAKNVADVPQVSVDINVVVGRVLEWWRCFLRAWKSFCDSTVINLLMQVAICCCCYCGKFTVNKWQQSTRMNGRWKKMSIYDLE